MKQKKSKSHLTEWAINEKFIRRGWKLVMQNGRHVLRKSF